MSAATSEARGEGTAAAAPHAYVIARVNVTDLERYREYVKRTPETIARHGGRFVVRGGQAVTLEGPAETGRVVVIEFPTLAQARAWYDSAEYQETRKLRLGAAEGTLIAVEGV